MINLVGTVIDTAQDLWMLMAYLTSIPKEKHQREDKLNVYQKKCGNTLVVGL
jgi:hypothetical protein